ncbi:hypothetical protein ACIO14_00605 [Nocardia fluminea]|uniref:hypothetical protein n=1 Tax=Nocardia fluminea TaxID=134984 RepID=UPI0037F59A91
MARKPEVFVREVTPDEGRRLQKITKTSRQTIRIRRAIVVSALVTDGAPAHRRTMHLAITLGAIGIGGTASAVLGRVLLPETHFQTLFLIGALPILLAPVISSGPRRPDTSSPRLGTRRGGQTIVCPLPTRHHPVLARYLHEHGHGLQHHRLASDHHDEERL